MGRSGFSESWARVLMDETIEIEGTISKLYEQVDALQDKIARMSNRYGEPERREFIHERYRAKSCVADDAEPPSKRESAEARSKAAALETLAGKMRDGTASREEVNAVLKAVGE